MGKNKIPIKTAEDIALMKTACKVTSQILDEVADIIKPGISTDAINDFVHKRTTELGAIPSPLNYRGYPKSVCVSPNDIVCHGVPSPYIILKAGDIVNVDVTSYKNGFHGDSSRMYFVGGKESCTEEAVKLVGVAKESLNVGINQVKPGAKIGDIGAAIKSYIDSLKMNYGIVTEYTGHGVGREFHEPPQVVHNSKKNTGEVMAEGMIFTIEPMINIGTWKTKLSNVDGWTVRTADGKLSAQWEHTVLVIKSGVEVLTLSGKT